MKREREDVDVYFRKKPYEDRKLFGPIGCMLAGSDIGEVFLFLEDRTSMFIMCQVITEEIKNNTDVTRI
jgi:hypothetical protein